MVFVVDECDDNAFVQCECEEPDESDVGGECLTDFEGNDKLDEVQHADKCDDIDWVWFWWK